MKHEWKKHEKELYTPKATPRLISVPTQQFIMICGKGNPNDADFSERVSALYAVAYAIKMGYKATASAEGISDFTVYPLEGVWEKEDGEELVKENLKYTIMIRQPDFITKEMVATVYKGNIIKNLIMDCQSYTKYRPNETTGGIFVSWRRKEELLTGA